MAILDLIFPKSCLDCGRSGKYICEYCIKNVRTPVAICPECFKYSTDGKTHKKCLNKVGLDGLTSLWNYERVIRKAILVLKYKHAQEIAKELAEYATHNLLLKKISERKPILIPVPLFWLRENWRGFNQSELVGKEIAERLGWKFESNILIRSKMKVPQTELKREERLLNVKGIFSLNPNFSSPLTQNLFILFDDVWTTGSTLKEAAKVLKRNGAKKVLALTLTRGIF